MLYEHIVLAEKSDYHEYLVQNKNFLLFSSKVRAFDGTVHAIKYK